MPRTSTLLVISVLYYKIYRRLIYTSKATIKEACRYIGITLIYKEDYFYKGYTIGKIIDKIGKKVPI